MSYQELLYEVEDRVATITLNRPDKLNAWTDVMEEEFLDAMREGTGDAKVRAIVVTGAGRAFCAGADLALLNAAAHTGVVLSGQRTEVDFPAAPPEMRKRYSWLLGVPKPVIAAINGPAVGLGFVIPLFCDIRLASSTARFCTIFAKRGLIAEYGIAWLLPRIVGLPHAIDLLFTARMVDATEALQLGLVTRVYPEAEFTEKVQMFARDLASSVSPRSLRVMKQQLYAALQQPLPAAIDKAMEELMLSLQCDDFREGVAHFMEKRPPRFPGR